MACFLLDISARRFLDLVGWSSCFQLDMRADADLAPVAMRQSGSDGGSVRQRAAGSEFSGSEAPPLLAATCGTSADNFLSVFRRSPLRCAEQRRVCLPLSFLARASRFLSRAAPTPLQRSRRWHEPPAPRGGGVHTQLEGEAERGGPGDRERGCRVRVPSPRSWRRLSVYRKLFRSASDFLSTPAKRHRTDQPPGLDPDILNEDLVVWWHGRGAVPSHLRPGGSTAAVPAVFD